MVASREAARTWFLLRLIQTGTKDSQGEVRGKGDACCFVCNFSPCNTPTERWTLCDVMKWMEPMQQLGRLRPCGDFLYIFSTSFS